jgi:hypothetical protein
MLCRFPEADSVEAGLMPLSKALVLAHLSTWKDHRNALVAAVAEGLMTRIEAGEMDEREEDD